MLDHSTEQRLETLKKLSTLRVLHRVEKSASVFEFYMGRNPVKTVFTYKKAKVFAEGVAIGIRLEKGWVSPEAPHELGAMTKEHVSSDTSDIVSRSMTNEEETSKENL